MKLKKMVKKGMLAAMVCMSLTSACNVSAAAIANNALPTGAEIVQGTLTGITTGADATSTTIATTGNSVINWQTFNIGQEAILSFDTTNGCILNRVTGGDISQLLGTLNVTGENALLIANPQGIIVGQNAIINATALTLAAADITVPQFNDIISGKQVNLETKGYIDVQKGTFNIGYDAEFYGKTIAIADGVTFTSAEAYIPQHQTANHQRVTIAAADNVGLKLDGDLTEVVALKATKDNTFSLSGTVDMHKMNAWGGKVDIKDFKMNGDGSALAVALSTYNDDKDGRTAVDTITANANSGGVTVGSNVKFATGDLLLAGKTVDIADGAKFNGKNFDVVAANKLESPDKNSVVTMDKANTVTIGKADINATEFITVKGGNVELNGTTLKGAKNEIFVIGAAEENQATNTIKASADNGLNLIVR